LQSEGGRAEFIKILLTESISINQYQSKMKSYERQSVILNQVQKNGTVSLGALVETLRSSTATIRRDLAELEREGKVVRTHGGAIYPPRMAVEPSFSEKKSRALSEKAAIAGRAVDDVAEGATVFIDAGTTCMEAGVRLLERGRNPIFTNSIPLLLVGCNYPGKITALGGEVRAVSHALTGALALHWLDQLHFDYALLGASAIMGDSVRTTEIQEAALKMAIHSHADQCFLLADAKKCTEAAAVKFLKLSDFNAWYVDAALPEQDAAEWSKDYQLLIKRC
jgi:DeoR family fructose operon transcriptional repressor